MASRAARTTRTKPYRARKPPVSDAELAASTPRDSDGLLIDGHQPFAAADAENPIDINPQEPDPTQMVGSTAMTPTDEGGMDVEFNTPNINKGEKPEFDSNLAEYIDDSTLKLLADQAIDACDKDKDSRADWESAVAEGIKLLGLNREDRDWPFAGASGVYDTLLSEAVTRDQAQTMAELLPAGGPVKTQIIGQSNDELEDQANRVKEFFNYYLCEVAEEYYPDRDQMFFWRALVGSTFTKTYMDPVLGRPVSPFITPDNFIVSFTTSHLSTSPRYTQIIPMGLREMKQRQMVNFYKDIDLGMSSLLDIKQSTSDDAIRQAVEQTEGKTASFTDKDMEFTVLEQHVDLDLEGFEHTDGVGDPTGMPLPYILSIDRESKNVLGLRRNWKKSDTNARKIQYFTHYKFLPGLGFYGLGYAHILGNPAYATTSLLRQISDGVTLNMFPGGLTNAQMKTGDNNVNIGPCEFRYVETAGQPIQNAVMPMPYKEVSPVSLETYKTIRENASSLANTQEIAVGEGRQDAPVGTTVALLEAATRVQAANIKRAHRALRSELKLFGALFAEHLPDKPYPFPVGAQGVLMKSDFANSRIDIIPVSDPNITSSAQRMMRAEVFMRMASQAPDKFDSYEVQKNMLSEMGVDAQKINRLLPPPQQAVPMDPLSENQFVLAGKPITTADWQDHQAHIAVHQALAQVPAMQAHIATHVGAQMRQQLQAQLGQLPQMGAKLPPELENKLSAMMAAAVQKIQSPDGQKDPTPEQIGWAQVQVEAQKVMADIENSKREQATQAFKATTQRQTDLDRMQSAERIAMNRESTQRLRNSKSNGKAN